MKPIPCPKCGRPAIPGDVHDCGDGLGPKQTRAIQMTRREAWELAFKFLGDNPDSKAATVSLTAMPLNDLVRLLLGLTQTSSLLQMIGAAVLEELADRGVDLETIYTGPEPR